MGLDCEPSASEPFEADLPLKLYGDYFSPDTRAMLIACKYAGIEIDFIEIDTFKK